MHTSWIKAPDAREKFVAGNCAATVCDEVGEDLGLAFGERFASLIGAGNFAAFEVDGSACEAESRDATRAFGAAAEDRFDAGDEFFCAEGFDDVIIGAFTEAFDAVGFFAFGGEHDDGEVGFGFADFAKKGEAVHARHENVEEDEAGVDGEKAFEAGDAIGGFGGLIACVAQGIAKAAADCGIVFNDEDDAEGHWRLTKGSMVKGQNVQMQKKAGRYLHYGVSVGAGSLVGSVMRMALLSTKRRMLPAWARRYCSPFVARVWQRVEYSREPKAMV